MPVTNYYDLFAVNYAFFVGNQAYLTNGSILQFSVSPVSPHGGLVYDYIAVRQGEPFLPTEFINFDSITLQFTV